MYTSGDSCQNAEHLSLSLSASQPLSLRAILPPTDSCTPALFLSTSLAYTLSLPRSLYPRFSLFLFTGDMESGKQCLAVPPKLLNLASGIGSEA